MKLLLFDIDGTLIRAGGAGRAALEKALTHAFGTFEGSETIQFDGKTDRAIIREIAATVFKTTDNQMAEVIDQVLEIYLTHLPETVKSSTSYTILPGIENALTQLSERHDIALGLATGNVEPGARHKLERGKLNHFFKIGGFGCDSESRAALVQKAVERAQESYQTRFALHDIFVIGDTEHDIRAGKEIGAKTVGVATGSFTTTYLAKYEPDFLFEDFSGWRKLFDFFD